MIWRREFITLLSGAAVAWDSSRHDETHGAQMPAWGVLISMSRMFAPPLESPSC
jgi:hypothetical protein